MEGRLFLNVPASQCAATVTDRGRGAFQHQGELFAVVGVYFANGTDGQRLLHYVLRALQGEGDEESALLFARKGTATS